MTAYAWNDYSTEARAHRACSPRPRCADGWCEPCGHWALGLEPFKSCGWCDTTLRHRVGGTPIWRAPRTRRGTAEARDRELHQRLLDGEPVETLAREAGLTPESLGASFRTHGLRVPRRECRIPEARLVELHREHLDGTSIRELGRRIYREIPYASPESARRALWGAFVAHGWETRSCADSDHTPARYRAAA